MQGCHEMIFIKVVVTFFWMTTFSILHQSTTTNAEPNQSAIPELHISTSAPTYHTAIISLQSNHGHSDVSPHISSSMSLVTFDCPTCDPTASQNWSSHGNSLTESSSDVISSEQSSKDGSVVTSSQTSPEMESSIASTRVMHVTKQFTVARGHNTTSTSFTDSTRETLILPESSVEAPPLNIFPSVSRTHLTTATTSIWHISIPTTSTSPLSSVAQTSESVSPTDIISDALINGSESNFPLFFQDTTSVQTTSSRRENDYLDIIIGRRCASDLEDSVWWNETDGGMLAVKSCPASYQGSAYRPCYTNGKWGRVDYSECRLERLGKMRQLVTFHVRKKLLGGLHHLAEEFAYFLATVELRSPLDRLEAFETLATMLKADLDLRMDKHLDVSYVQALLHCTDELLTRKNVFFSFETEKNHVMTQKAAEIVFDLTTFAEKALRGLLLTRKKQMTFRAARNIVMHLYRGHGNRSGLTSRKNSSVDFGKTEEPSATFNMEYALESAAYALLWIRGIGSLLNTGNVIVNSDIALATSIPPTDILMESSPVAFEVNLRKKKESEDGVYILECGFLWNTTSLWRSNECFIVAKKKNMVRCRCSHLGSIALLLRKTSDPEKGALPSQIRKVIILSCVVSLITVVLTFIIHIFHYRRDPPDSSLILLNLLISMGTTQIVFMAGINATKRQELCYSVALVLHYLFLVSSFWLVSFSIHVYRVLRHDPRPSGRVRDYCILSWIVPVALVIVSFTVNPRGYETARYCWLSIQRGMLLSFIVPVTALILINTIVMVLVLKTFNEQIAVTRKTEIDRTRTSMRAGVTLLPLFAVNWFFGVLAVEDSSTIAFQYAFSFTNTVQGTLVFVFYCVMDVDIRHSLRNKFTKHNRKQRLSAMKLKKSCSFPVRDRSMTSLNEERRRPDSQPLLSGSLSYSPLSEDPCCSNIRV